MLIEFSTMFRFCSSFRTAGETKMWWTKGMCRFNMCGIHDSRNVHVIWKHAWYHQPFFCNCFQVKFEASFAAWTWEGGLGGCSLVVPGKRKRTRWRTLQFLHILADCHTLLDLFQALSPFEKAIDKMQMHQSCEVWCLCACSWCISWLVHLQLDP